MRRRFLAVLVLCCVPLIGGAAPEVERGEAAAGAARLLPKHLKAANAAIEAYLRSDSIAALKALGPLVGQLKPEQRAALDEYLSSNGFPAVGPLLAEARLASVYQGQADKLPKPKPPETLLVLPALGEQIASILTQHESHAIMAAEWPRPASLREFEGLFWDLHVLDNRLESARQMADYAATLVGRVPKSTLDKATADQQAHFAADYKALSLDIAARRADLAERKLELRIDRLTRSADVLERPQLSGEKFLAAFAASLDTPALVEAFATDVGERRDEDRPAFQRPRLSAEDVREEVASVAARAAQAAGDLTEKSQLLHSGLHWWLRGRYGAGPDYGGLAKSALAMRSPEAQFWLFMPAATPLPTDPAQPTATGPYSPQYERRHHYVWALEDRRVARRETFTASAENYDHQFTVTTDTFW